MGGKNKSPAARVLAGALHHFRLLPSKTGLVYEGVCSPVDDVSFGFLNGSASCEPIMCRKITLRSQRLEPCPRGLRGPSGCPVGSCSLRRCWSHCRRCRLGPLIATNAGRRRVSPAVIERLGALFLGLTSFRTETAAIVARISFYSSRAVSSAECCFAQASFCA